MPSERRKEIGRWWKRHDGEKKKWNLSQHKESTWKKARGLGKTKYVWCSFLLAPVNLCSLPPKICAQEQKCSESPETHLPWVNSQTLPKSLLDVLELPEVTTGLLVRVWRSYRMIGDIGQEEDERKLLSGPSWTRSHTHDFILKWQEKQNTLKQGFSSSPNSNGCTESCRSVRNTANWHLHMQMSYKCAGPNFGLCLPGQRGQREHVSISRRHLF